MSAWCRFFVPQSLDLLPTPRRGWRRSRVSPRARRWLPAAYRSSAAARLQRGVLAPEFVCLSVTMGTEPRPPRFPEKLRLGAGSSKPLDLPSASLSHLLSWPGRSWGQAAVAGQHVFSIWSQGHLRRAFPQMGTVDHRQPRPGGSWRLPGQTGLRGRGGAAKTGRIFILFYYLFNGT